MTTTESTVESQAIESNHESSLQAAKRRCLIWICIACPVMAIALFCCPAHFHKLIDGASAIVIMALTLSWCIHDCRLRNYRPGRIKLYLTAALSPFSMPIYFIKSRGWKQGMIATLRLTGFIFILIVVLIITGFCIVPFV